jgi:formylglycine-generating enzyme required for sulfatase activity
VQPPEVSLVVRPETDSESDTIEELDDTQSDSVETDEATGITSSLASWDFAAAHVQPERKTKWVVGGLVGLLSLIVLVTVYTTGGRWRTDPPTGQPTPALWPKVPGMVYIAGGEFTMGSDTGDEYERPAHKVKLSSFYLDVYEVTCEEYLKFAIAKGHRLPAKWTNGSFPAGAAKQPVTGVDWYDATAYAEWAGKRLPTEEEWEFSARGTNGGRYPWGNNWITNAANAGDSSAQRLQDVGSFPGGKTSAGVMDMIGNAWEWTASDVSIYPGGHFSSPVPNSVKVIRGGSWQEKQQQATTTYRGFLRMSGAEDYSATGFRCVKDANTVLKPSTIKSTGQ